MGLGWVDISNREVEERSYTGMDIEAGKAVFLASYHLGQWEF